MLNAKSRLRDMSVYRVAAASLSHVAIYPEVQVALEAWVALGVRSVLIGGLAMSLYAKPRMTEDVDVLFLHDSEIPESGVGFKRVSNHSMQENKTHVVVEIVTSKTFPIPQSLVEQVFATAVPIDGMMVASREGLIALKLHGADEPKRRLGDLADVARIVKADTTMQGWNLSPWHIEVFQSVKAEAL